MKDSILKFNEEFVASKGYEPYITSKYPDKKIAIVTCMDTRLVELLPAALGIKNGDVKMIKNAGGLVPSPWDSSMRSILVAVYELGVNHVMIIGHTQCGVEGMKGEDMLRHIEKRGIPAATLSLIERCGIDLKEWLTGFCDTKESVEESVSLVKNHPLLPADVEVSGYIMDSTTGKLMPLS